MSLDLEATYLSCSHNVTSVQSHEASSLIMKGSGICNGLICMWCCIAAVIRMTNEVLVIDGPVSALLSNASLCKTEPCQNMTSTLSIHVEHPQASKQYLYLPVELAYDCLGLIAFALALHKVRYHLWPQMVWNSHYFPCLGKIHSIWVQLRKGKTLWISYALRPNQWSCPGPKTTTAESLLATLLLLGTERRFMLQANQYPFVLNW